MNSFRTMSLVVGLGEVGRPLLSVLSRAHRVLGIDLPPSDVPEPVDMLHICYPGEISDFVTVTAAYAQKYRPSVVIIHSTVAVGTTRAVQSVLSVPVVHSPVRGKHSRMAADLVHYVKFVGSDDRAIGDRVERHLQVAGMRTRQLSSPEATELAKLTETTYFGVLIAFAQDVARMARKSGVDYDEITSFYEEIGYLPPVRYTPGLIGGHCVMPNIALLKRAFESNILDSVEWSNKLRKAEDSC